MQPSRRVGPVRTVVAFIVGAAAFSAGALLAMSVETMISEAFHASPRLSGIVTALGFCLLLLVQALAG